jgi:predicted small metal-binding protein
MKTLACGDIMPGCGQKFREPSEDAILAQAGRHAVDAHGTEVTPEVVELVRAHIRDEK